MIMNTTAGYIGESFWNFDTTMSLLVLFLLFIAMCIPAIAAYKCNDKKQMWISIGCGFLGMFLLIPWIISIIQVLKKYEMPAKGKGIIKPWIFVGDSFVLILIGISILVRNYTQWGSVAGISLIIYGVGLQIAAFLSGKGYWAGLMVMAPVLVSCIKFQYTEPMYVLYEGLAIVGAGLILCNVIGIDFSVAAAGKIVETVEKTLESVKEKQIEPTARAGRKMVRCERGHFYDFEEYGTRCPYCNPVIQKVISPVVQNDVQPMEKPLEKERMLKEETSKEEEKPKQPIETEKRTVHKQKEPVIGWLVCIEGVYKGESFQLKTGRNFIGRAKEMDICLQEDASIAEYNQAALIYEPRTKQFIVVPGEVRELCYLNQEVVLANAVMNAYDVLNVGDISLMLVPCCGKQFCWEEGVKKKTDL